MDSFSQCLLCLYHLDLREAEDELGGNMKLP